MRTSITRWAGALTLTAFVGCVTPEYSNTNRVDVDDESVDGGISATDVRSVATKMCPAVLAVPEIANGEAPVRIKVANMKNSSRFFIDKNLFTKRLCIELNRYGQGQVRFLSNNEAAQAGRVEVLEDRRFENLKKEIREVARAFVASPVVANAQGPVKVAVIPAINTNLVGLNADSFSAMFRSEVSEAANGKVQFLMPGVVEGADYWITGQFYPETMKTEGIINLTDYFAVVDERVKSGKDLYIPEIAMANVSPIHASVAATGTRESIFLEMLRNPAFRQKPNCDKKFNLMVVRPAEKLSVWEKTVTADRRISGKAASARYVLSGEISGLSQNANGRMSDYLLISMELVDPETNETVWQDAYEVKRVTRAGTVYR